MIHVALHQVDDQGNVVTWGELSRQIVGEP